MKQGSLEKSLNVQSSFRKNFDHFKPRLPNFFHLLLIYFLLINLKVSQINCVLPPPKFLPRIVAGFYSFHPAYDSDKKAEVLFKMESRPKHHFYYYQDVNSPDKNYHNKINKYHQKFKFSKNNNPYQHVSSSSSYKEKENKIKYVQENHKNKSLNKEYSKNYPKKHQSHYVGKPFYWDQMAYILNQYVIMAEQMAKYYGQKYHYPADLLKWQIIEVMFPSNH